MNPRFAVRLFLPPFRWLRPLGETPPGLVGLLVLCGLLLACGEDASQSTFQPRQDLIEESVDAEVIAETPHIVFGTDTSRPYLIHGFAGDAFEKRLERPFVWGVGDASEVRWVIMQPRPLTIDLELRPFHDPDAPPQTVDVSLNGTPLERLQLHRGVTSYPIVLPVAAQRLGNNVLRFEYAWHRSPHQMDAASTDRRRLAVAFFSLARRADDPSAQAAVEDGRPQVDMASSRLFIPQGTRLDFYLRLAGASRLRADAWTFRGPGSRLRIRLQEEEAPVVVAADLSRPPQGGFVDLPGDGERVVKLSVESLVRDDSAAPLDRAQGIVWTGPRIESRQAPAPLPPTDHPGDAETASAASDPSPQTPSATLPHVFLYMMDTLRADHLGTYGYHRDTSPHLDALADEALLFERAIAQSSWTRSSIASLMTGLWPLAHGTNQRNDVLNEDAVTLQEKLRAKGYRTAAFFSNPNISELFGFRQGFDHVVDLSASDVDATEIHRHVLEWLDAQDDSAPLFLYIHTIDPHSPYDPPAPFRQRLAPQVADDVAWTATRLPRAVRRRRAEPTPEMMAEMIDLYDAEIAAGDAAFGELRQALEARRLFTDSWLVVLSDHGEEFLEHGYLEHGKNLFGESLNIPWILKPPGAPGTTFEPRRIAEPIQHIDLLPTLSRALGLEVDPTWQGRDLSVLWRGDRPLPETTIYSYLHLDGEPRVSLVDDPWKLIHRVKGDRLVEPRLYHLPSDPEEQHDVSAQRPIRQRYLSKILHRRWRSPEGRLEQTTTELDESLKQRLEALGYLQ